MSLVGRKQPVGTKQLAHPGYRLPDTGSSPHAREAPLSSSRWWLADRDHPRMRGEHSETSLLRSMAAGSSPHARRARHHRGRWAQGSGIIPACAGSTQARGLSGRHGGNHPRMRGEHSRSTWGVGLVSGSSPHARGVLDPARILPPLSGIISACAGSTPKRIPAPDRSRDHPRMRGEHLISLIALVRDWGSSPHARRALKPRHHIIEGWGIIPACAGSTSPASRT